ncbi:MAG TPA: signal peptidase I [Candidatus Limnocylindrales bacterium]
MRHSLRGLRIALDVALMTLVGVVLVVVVANAAAPLLGERLVVIRGGSMVPAIPLGGLVVEQESGLDRVAAGDVVTIRAGNGVLVTHRIVRVVTVDDAGFVQSKGDANAAPDPDLAPLDHVIGRVVAVIPLAGYLLYLLGQPLGILAVLCLAATLLVATWLVEELEADAVEADEADEARAEERVTAWRRAGAGLHDEDEGAAASA